MRYRKITGLFALIVSLVLFVVGRSVTGNVVSVGDLTGVDFAINVISLAFFVVGILLLTARKRETLDAIIILGSPYEADVEKKTNRAVDFGKNNDVKVYVATGGKTPSLKEKYHSEAQMIYNGLRAAGIRPANIRADTKAKNTIDNIVNSLKKIDGNEIGVVSTPSHLKRVEDIVKQGKKEGIFDKNLHIHEIEIGDTLPNRGYEFLARTLNKYRLRKGIGNLESSEGPIKKVVNYIMRFFKEEE